MLWQWSPAVIAELAASAILLILAIYFPWRDLNRQARFTSVTLVFICALWIQSHAIEIALPVVSYKETLVGLQLVWGMIAMTLWLFYILHYLGPRKLLTQRIYILSGIMPVIAILALYTNNMYGLMWTASGIDSQNPYLPLQPTYGIIYWACMVYAAILTLTGSFLLIWNIVRRRYSYRRESIFLLAAAVLPLVTAFIEVMGLVSDLKLSVGLSSWTACIGTIIVILNLPKLHSEQVIPIARDIVFERIGDCILVLDMQDRILDLNPAAEQLIGYRISDAIGLSINKLWPFQSTPMMSFNEMAKAGVEPVLERDGKQRTYALHISTINESGRGIISKVVLLTDITERKQKDEALLESEQQYRTLVTQSQDGIFVVDLKGTFLSVNKSMCEGLKYSKEELLSMNIWDIVPVQFRGLHEKRLADILVGKAPNAAAEYVVRRKDGNLNYVEILSAPYYKGKELIGFQGIARDITERKQATIKIKESEILYRSIIETSPDAIGLMDLSGTIIMHNKQALELFGFDLTADLIGKNIMDLVAAENYKEVLENMEKLQRAEAIRNWELTSYKKDGQPFYLELSSSMLFDENGEPKSIMAVFRDITERKQKGEALRESELEFRSLAESMPQIVWITRPDGWNIYFNQHWMDYTGMTLEESYGHGWNIPFHPDDRQAAWDAWQNATRNGATYSLECRLRRADGVYTWWLIRGVPVMDEHGNILKWFGTCTDINELKRGEDALQKSEHLYRSLFDNMLNGFAYCKMLFEGGQPRDFIYLLVNDAFKKQTGLKDVTGKMVSEVIPGIYETDDQLLKSYGRVALTGIPESFQIYVAALKMWFSMSVYSPQKEYFVAIFDDVTERKLNEEKLEKSYQSLKKTLNDAIDTMAKIVETRDPYTAGHQQRVADLANAIAGEMKLEDTRIDQIRMAAVIHDIGKMYIPSEILSKPGKLSAMEFNLIKTHAQAGYDIVKGIDLPCSVAQAILQHHERPDGSGYPNQLKGNDIIMEAKILAVADVIEAMASHRPYRPALGIDKALEELLKNRGKLYDPDVVDACVQLFNSGKFEFKSV